MTNKVRRFTAIISAMVITMCSAFAMPKKAYAAETVNYIELIDEIAALVNEAREAAGLEPLYLAPQLCETSNLRAEECVSSFSHTRPNGQKFQTALNYNVVPFTKVAENLAAGNSSAEATFEQWKNSPSHWAAIMNPNYTHLGVGVTYSADSVFGWYWTQTFVTTNIELEGQQIIEMDQISPLRMANEKTSFTYGDVNEDGCVNSFDSIALVNYCFGKIELSSAQIQACDVMQDGEINIADVIVLRRYILGAYESLPVIPAE